MSAAAFGAIVVLSSRGFEADRIDDYKGLNARNPWLAGLILCVMASLAGLPPFLGFWAKLAVLRAALEGGIGAITTASNTLTSSVTAFIQDSAQVQLAGPVLVSANDTSTISADIASVAISAGLISLAVGGGEDAFMVGPGRCADPKLCIGIEFFQQVGPGAQGTGSAGRVHGGGPFGADDFAVRAE